MEVGLLELRNTEATVVMAGCTNGDRVDEVRVGHVGQVGHGAVLVSRVRSADDERDRVVLWWW